MIVTNHILAGAVIGLVIEQPVIAITAALASHFVMDALPHFGYPGNRGYGEALKHRLSYGVAIGTMLTSAAVIAFLAYHREWLALGAGLAAAAPDCLGFYSYAKYEKYGKRAEGVLDVIHVKFHRAIQWCERPWGAWVEIGAMVLLATVLCDLVLR